MSPATPFSSTCWGENARSTHCFHLGLRLNLDSEYIKIWNPVHTMANWLNLVKSGQSGQSSEVKSGRVESRLRHQSNRSFGQLSPRSVN